MSFGNSIQVAIKMRPLLAKEKDMTSRWQLSENTITLVGSQSGEPYCFDYVFDQDASNQLIFEKMAKHIVHSAVHGFNGTIFAYGQTASGKYLVSPVPYYKTFASKTLSSSARDGLRRERGIFSGPPSPTNYMSCWQMSYRKTYTMMGEENDPGVMVLAAKEVFNEINRTSNCQFLLRGGFIEIYNEKIYDLLKKSNQDLKIYETNGGNVNVNCEEVCITSEERLLHVLKIGNDARTVGETNMNDRSSRSHGIFRLIIESRQADCEDDDKVTQSVLNLVDLAGSERANQTGAHGARLKEGAHINKSLLFLSNVIKRLSENEDNKYISFRDSKLTRILQASLGGNAFTSIICTVNPTSLEETQSTLNFAMRAKTIKNRPQVNEIVSDATMMKRLTREIKDLRKQLEKERSKTASHLKVAQIEKLLGFKELKFVNSSTAKPRSNQENRRRTWCPENVNTDMNASVSLPSSNRGRNRPENSHIKPLKSSMFLTPHITLRDTAPMNKLPVSVDVAILEDEFQPAELTDFNNFPSTPKTPEPGFWQAKPLSSPPQYCSRLQVQLAKLTEDKQAAEQTVKRYESELFELKTKLQHLECEDRTLTGLQFELETLRNKSKLREKELLEALNERDQHIAELEEKLRKPNADNMPRSKDEPIHLSPCKSVDSANSGSNDGQRKSLAAEDLQRIVDDNSKVSLEFEKLNTRYRKLQSDYQKLAADALSAQEIEEAKCTQCEELREEVADLCLKLKAIERGYEELEADRNKKSERCESLSREVEVAQQQVCMGQNKYVDLEANWMKQKEALAVIKADNDALEKKYEELRATYESSELTFANCTADCTQLKNENDELKNEIQKLKTRVEDMQEERLDGWGSTEKSISKENVCLEPQKDNDELKDQLKELQEQYERLQQEYDQLSTNVMEAVQESDTLTASCKSLEEKLKESEKNRSALDAARVSWESERASLEEQISDLQQRLESYSTSQEGVSGDRELHVNSQKPLIEFVELIELDCGQGKCRTYTAIDTPCRAEGAISCKMSLRDWEGGKLTRENDQDGVKNGIDFGVLKALLTHAHHSEQEGATQGFGNEESVQQLQEKIHNLEEHIRALQEKNEALFQSSQRNINDLREVIENLTAELCEKSMVLEDLVKEKAEITLLNEELQMKIATSLSDINITSCSATSFSNQTVRQGSAESFSENSMTNDDALKAIKNELIDREEECNRLKLEMLEKLELSESEFRANLRRYNEEWEQSRQRYMLRIEKLEEMLFEKGISVKKEEPSFEEINDGDDPETSKIKCEYEENCAAAHEGGKSSTPTASGTSVACSEHYSEIKKSRMENSQIIQQCNEQISKLSEAIQDAKAVNAQLSETLDRKEELLQEKDEELESLRMSIELLESKVRQMSENELELGVVERLQSEEKDEEISKLTAALKESEEKAHELLKELEAQRLIGDKESTDLKCLRSEYSSLVGERNELLARIDRLMEENNACAEKIEGIEKEQAELRLRVESLLSAKEDESNKRKLQAEADMEALESIRRELADSHELHEKLRQELEQEMKNKMENQAAVEDLKRQVRNLESIDGEHSRLQSKFIVLKSELAKSEKAFQKEKHELMKELEECKTARDQMSDKLETLSLKLDATEQELRESNLRSAGLEKTLLEYEGKEQELSVTNQKRAELEHEVSKLSEELSRMRDNLSVSNQLKDKEMEKLQAKLREVQAAYTATHDEHESLRQQVALLKTELCDERKKLQRDYQELQSQLNEFQSKCAALEEANAELLTKNIEMKERLADAQRHAVQSTKIRELLHDAQSEKRALQLRFEMMVAENEKGTASLQNKLEEQERACEDLKSALEAQEAAFEATKLKLQSEITTRESKNRALVERLQFMEGAVKKRSDPTESVNTSIEAKTPSQTSTLGLRSPCKTMALSANVCAEDKLLSVQKGQKNRRLSTHDENRRRSATFLLQVDASTMTEQVTNDCQCEELKQQLKECETQLFIKDSQVRGLNYDLRHNPLKAEKQQLMKRIQEEQNKYRLEMKKYETKIAEQEAKIKLLADKAKIAATIPVAKSVVTVNQSTCTSPRGSVQVAETQTDMAIDKSLQKLQGKYNDLKTICRSRYNQIKNLTKIVEEKENICQQCTAVNQLGQKQQ